MPKIQVDLTQEIKDGTGKPLVLNWLTEEGKLPKPVYLTIRDVIVQTIAEGFHLHAKELSAVEKRRYGVLADRVAMAKDIVSMDSAYIEKVKEVALELYSNPHTVQAIASIFNSILCLVEDVELDFEEIGEPAQAKESTGSFEDPHQ